MYKPNFIELNKLVGTGYLAKKESGNLVLFNYSEKCTFEKNWTKHTINSRGTVYEKSTEKVIGRALPKFYNFSELAVSKQRNILKQERFEVYTKVDGSMGVVYFYNNKWNVSTRGSFESEQAIKATQMLSKYNLSKLNKAFTYIVEIIYPENRIIVNYGSKEELVLLACIETKTGAEADLEALAMSVPFPIAQSHKFSTIDDVIEAVSKMDSNSEGYVVKLPNGERFKVKSPEYLKIARLMSRMSPLTLWENMVSGYVSKELLESIPEEFRVEYEDIQTELERQYSEISVEINRLLQRVLKQFDETVTKRDIALYLKDNPNELNQFVFPLFDKKYDNVDKMIMKKIRPTGNIL